VGKGSQRKAATRRDNRDRKQRVEELKRQQHAAERRKTMLSIFGGLGAGVVIVAAALVPGFLHDRAQKQKKSSGFTAAVSAAEKAAGCTGVHNDVVSPGAEHVTTPVDYAATKYGDTKGGTPAIPPTSGKHNPDPLPAAANFYPLSVKAAPERAVHNLEHGFVVGWFDDKLPQSQVDELQKLSSSLDRFLAVGWTRGELPAGKHFVLTSWGRTERCSSVSANVVQTFWKDHMNKPPAPEIGSPGGSNDAPSLLTPGGAAMTTPPNPSPTTTKK
jgi:hypothetical protein